MTNVAVPSRRGLITYTDVLSGRAVRAITWQDWAQLVTWMTGRGAQLSAAHSPAVKMAGGTVFRSHLLTRGNYAGIQRLWCFWLRGNSQAGTVSISINGGTAVTYPVPASRVAVSPILVVHDVSSQQTAAEDLRYDITTAVDFTAWVDAVSVFEVPRVVLDSATAELGIVSDPFRAGQPIRNADFANGSEVLSDGEYGRRHLYSWGVPHNLNAALTKLYAWQTNSATLVDMFDLDPPLLARKGVPGETARAVRVRYTAVVDTGVTAEVYIGTTSRAPTLAHTITSTTFATYSTTQTVDVEDTSEASGLQSGAWDGLRIQAKITAGVGSVYLFAVAVYED